MTEQSKPLSPAILERMEQALLELDDRRVGWFEAVRQDAVETFPRLSRWHQCHIGCRVPVLDMVVNPLRRDLRLVAERFAADAAVILAVETHRSAPSLELAGRGVELNLIADPLEVDFVFRKGWFQGIVNARRKFEADMLLHLEAIYNTVVRSHLHLLMIEIVTTMQKTEATDHSAEVGNTSLGG